MRHRPASATPNRQAARPDRIEFSDERLADIAFTLPIGFDLPEFSRPVSAHAEHTTAFMPLKKKMNRSNPSLDRLYVFSRLPR
jgi:hypothetical protein